MLVSQLHQEKVKTLHAMNVPPYVSEGYFTCRFWKTVLFFLQHHYGSYM